MSSLGYRPGLDGLRGIGLIAVLLFHAELGLAPGAWGGVSMFFTLSGFLICSLLLREHAQEGKISLKAFYVRRARRLLPALLLTLAGIALFGATVADSSQLRELRGDVIAALAYVANWRFGLGTESYADLFASPSPVLHFWTVAIEEQFYLLFPPALALLLARRRHTDPLAALLIAYGIAIVVLVASGAAGVDHDLIYFGTHTRASKLLAGSVLAALVHRGSLEPHMGALRWAGPGGLVAMLAVWAGLDIDSDVLYRGGFAAYGVLSAVVVLAAATPGNLVESLLRREPMRTLGTISYGVYLFHWPIFRWLTPERTDLDDAPLLALRFVLSIGAGYLSYHLLEHPIRRRRALRGNQAVVALGVAAAVALAGTVVVTADLDDPLIGPSPAPVPDGGYAIYKPLRSNTGTQIRVAMYGDSIGQQLGTAMGGWANDADDQRQALGIDGGEPGIISVEGYTEHGCGLLGSVRMRYRGEIVRATERGCGSWRELWGTAAARYDPDVAVVSTGPWAVTDLELPGTDELRHIGEPLVDDALRTEMEAVVQLFTDRGIDVVWVLAPHIESGTIDGVRPAESFAESDPARIDRYNELVREVVARHPGDATTIDLTAYLDTLPGGEMDVERRPDLIHFTLEAADDLTASWLGPAVLSAAEQLRG